MKIYDMHTHFSKNFAKEVEYRAKNGIKSVVAVTNPLEIDKKIENKNIIYSYGLHPWNANKFDVNDMIKYFDNAKIIGEIGLDSVWCDVDLELQRQIFVKQLDFSNGKPIILHTKGQEKEVFDIIYRYSNEIKIVHWYSCKDYIDDYIKLGCYFTISADLSEITDLIIEKVSINKILIETDGLGALKWVLEREVSFDDIKNSLENTIKHIAKIKNIDYLSCFEQISKNSEEILKKATNF